MTAAIYWVVTAGEEIWVTDRVTEVGPDDVESQAGRRLVGHLDAVL